MFRVGDVEGVGGRVWEEKNPKCEGGMGGGKEGKYVCTAEVKRRSRGKEQEQ